MSPVHTILIFGFISFTSIQVTRGGGALTLASQWKSQFDDSEETTDNEWKQEPQVYIAFDSNSIFSLLIRKTNPFVHRSES